MARKVQRLRPRFRLSISVGSIFFLLGTIIVGLTAIDADANLLVLVFGFCVGAWIISLLVGWQMLRRVSVRRHVPDVVVAGQPFELRYTVTNRSRWFSAWSIRIEDTLAQAAFLGIGGWRRRIMGAPAFLPHLGPGRTEIARAPVLIARRGRARLSGVRVASAFPFRLIRKSATHAQNQDVVVLPPLGYLRTEPMATSRAGETAGADGSSSRIVGEEEIYGVREYRPGDNPRNIHWRRSARTGELVVREMSRTRARQIWCVVNTRSDRRSQASSDRLELAISCAATVVCHALERGLSVGLICNGDPLVVLPPSGGRQRRPQLLRELALRELNYGDALAPHLRALAWPSHWRGPCLMFGAAQDEDINEAAALFQAAVGPTRVYVPGRPAFEELFEPPRGVLSSLDKLRSPPSGAYYSMRHAG